MEVTNKLTELKKEMDDELHHYYCECDPNIALCGSDLTDTPEVQTEENACLVCKDMDNYDCPRCGT